MTSYGVVRIITCEWRNVWRISVEVAVIVLCGISSRIRSFVIFDSVAYIIIVNCSLLCNLYILAYIVG